MSIVEFIHKGGKGLAQCLPDQSVLEAAKHIVARGVNALAVVQKDGRLAGIITDHDIMRALATMEGQLQSEPVTGWMTCNVITCTKDTKPSVALQLMGQHRIRHLVVVENDGPLAIVGIREVLAKAHHDDKLEINVLRDLAVAHAS